MKPGWAMASGRTQGGENGIEMFTNFVRGFH
jgi:hypothetical protein